jgi:maltose alpha-D-glucosyltransferase/alpha-amylase
MGDNIWLDDRDGVRTPMQWSAGTNADFSTAEPGALYAPVIDDEVYGYRQVNVEAQRADASSLYHLMRHMIRVRKEQPALGRGDVRFLEGIDPSLLVFLRTYQEQTILAVHNLSSEPRSFHLDLEGHAGVRPVDLLHGERLPAIGSAPYALTLPRHGYRWLSL